MAPSSRRIVATITLEEKAEGQSSSFGYPSYQELIETKISISLPVPNEGALPEYLAEQISGFLAIATEGPTVAGAIATLEEPREPDIDDTPPGSDDDSEPADVDEHGLIPA